MRSSLPKVLQPLAEKTLIDHVVDTAEAIQDRVPIVVVGHGADLVKSHLSERNVRFAYQAEQLGTGHAVAQALHLVQDDDIVLVLYGDVPLVTTQTLRILLENAKNGALAWLSTLLDNPSGFGRIVRNARGDVVAIVEEKDATPAQRELCEVNTGILAVQCAALKRWAGQLDCKNAQREYYLTDCLSMAVAEGVQVKVHRCTDSEEVLGINDKSQLSIAERALQKRRSHRLLKEGVTLRDPMRLDIRGEVIAGSDVEIDVGVILKGKVRLGDRCYVGPYTVLNECDIGAGTRIEAHSIIENANIAPNCSVGPFSRLRPGTHLSEGARVGNFVEIKNSSLGRGSKVNHLSYIGDSTLGEKVNIGAGTITCNYDGVNKHRTSIGDNAFIGSNTALVAPVNVGKSATIGAGSVISKDAPAGKLTLARAPQITIPDWKRPGKKEG